MTMELKYKRNLAGVDWDEMKVKYGKLVPYATCRQDLGFIIGELIGELNTSHTYVFGGDRQRRPDQGNVGMLGVDWEADGKSGRYRFGKICRVADWTREIIPPLRCPASISRRVITCCR